MPMTLKQKKNKNYIPEIKNYLQRICLGGEILIDFLIEILRSQHMVLIFMKNAKIEKTGLQVSSC